MQESRQVQDMSWRYKGQVGGVLERGTLVASGFCTWTAGGVAGMVES